MLSLPMEFKQGDAGILWENRLKLDMKRNRWKGISAEDTTPPGCSQGVGIGWMEKKCLGHMLSDGVIHCFHLNLSTPLRSWCPIFRRRILRLRSYKLLKIKELQYITGARLRWTFNFQPLNQVVIIIYAPLTTLFTHSLIQPVCCVGNCVGDIIIEKNIL